MIKSYLKRSLRRFSRHYDYDTGYLVSMVDADIGGALRFALASPFLGYRFGLSAEVYYAAKIRSAMAADCGPCTKLALQMATEAGADRTLMLKVATGAALPDDIELAARFGDQVAANDPALVETVEKARERFGQRGLCGLAGAAVAGQFYPLLKRGLGHASSCEPVIAAFRAELQGGGKEMHHAENPIRAA